jgi:protein-tyrosine phosphatase
LTGVFGTGAKYWGERFVGEGLTHILASDAHSSGRRIPVLSEGLAVAERLLGREEAQLLVQGRPSAIMNDLPPGQVAPLPASQGKRSGGPSWLRRLLKR